MLLNKVLYRYFFTHDPFGAMFYLEKLTNLLSFNNRDAVY